MKSLVLYYSCTGTTATVARALATGLEADIAEIKCPRYGSGWLGYLLSGYDSLKGRLPAIEVPGVSFADYDLIVLGAPIWTSYPATPLRALLSKKNDLTELLRDPLSDPLSGRIALFLTYGGHSPPEKAVDLVVDLLPIKLEASLAIKQDAVNEGGSTASIDAFIAKLRAFVP